MTATKQRRLALTDLQVDWQEVADEMGITNGHAARMRYSRFKGQMEGPLPAARRAKAAVPRKKKAKTSHASAAQNDSNEEEMQGSETQSLAESKTESTDVEENMVGVETGIKSELAVGSTQFIKAEPNNGYVGAYASAYNTVPEQGVANDGIATGQAGQDSSESLVVKTEPFVKPEPQEEV